MGAKLSVIIPAFNEEKMIYKTHQTLKSLLESAGIEYELIFVNDGSKDATWEMITQVCMDNQESTGICFSRNFGKEAAIFAGLGHACGDVILKIKRDDPI